MIQKRINQGEMIPPFYGIAWHEYARDAAVCYPVPLNIVAGMARNAWFFLTVGWQPVRLNPRAAYIEGFNAGRASVMKVSEAE